MSTNHSTVYDAINDMENASFEKYKSYSCAAGGMGGSMKIKVSEATKQQLNWMVAKCEEPRTRYQDYRVVDGELYAMFCDVWLYYPYSPSTDWPQGGPIIEREGIDIEHYVLPEKGWMAGIINRARAAIAKHGEQHE